MAKSYNVVLAMVSGESVLSRIATTVKKWLQNFAVAGSSWIADGFAPFGQPYPTANFRTLNISPAPGINT